MTTPRTDAMFAKALAAETAKGVNAREMMAALLRVIFDDACQLERELAEAAARATDREAMWHACERKLESALRPSLAALEEWSRQVRLTIRGIDGQAERRTHRSHYLGETEEIIDGYQLNTGLWHRMLGLLASCPVPEGPLDTPPPSPLAAPKGHDDAKARIEACVKEIEIITDEFGYDPSEWLADKR